MKKAVAIFILFLWGCAIPKIIILDDPLTPEEHLNLGVTYEKAGEFDQAIREYELALKNKKTSKAYLYIGNAYFGKNDFDKAERYYLKAVKKAKGPDDADAYNNLAWLYYLRGKELVRAEELCLKALEMNPMKKEIYSDTLMKIRELKAANSSAEQAN